MLEVWVLRDFVNESFVRSPVPFLTFHLKSEAGVVLWNLGDVKYDQVGTQVMKDLLWFEKWKVGVSQSQK